MKKSVVLYQMSVKNLIKMWQIELSGSKITTSWGYKGGVFQSTIDLIKPTGKIGTKSHRTAEQQAALEFDRIVLSKKEKGYVENESDTICVTKTDKMTFNPLPVGFTPPKPIKEYPVGDKLAKLFAKRILLQKKYDGSCCLIVKHEGGWDLYTRTLEKETENFPRVVDLLKKLNVPDNSIMVGELYVGNGETMTEFDIINSMTPRTTPEVAIEKQKTHNVSLVIFDVMFWDTESVCDEIYSDRLKYAESVLRGKGGEIHLPYGCKLESLEEFKTEFGLLKKRNWEGYVMRDLDAPTAYTLNGKETRPTGCWKVKNIQEDEFIATGYELGSGKNRDKVGKLNIIQYRYPDIVLDCGNVGGGLSDEQREEALGWEYPCVIRVQFDRRQDAKDGCIKLRYPVFLCKHKEKTPKECLYNG